MLDYWQAQLTDIPQVHNLPLDKGRPTTQNFAGSTVIVQLPKALETQLQHLANEQDATLFMLLQSAFALLLGRYSAEEQFVMGTAVANRQDAKLEPLIGFFVNTLVLRNHFDKDSDFTQYLAESKKMALEAFDNQQLPFDLLVEQLQPERNLSHNPVCQVMFALQNNESTTLALDNLTITPLSTNSSVAKFDLTLSITPTDDGLEATWEYATALFDRVSIEQLAQSYQCLLDSICQNPKQNIYRLALANNTDLLSDQHNENPYTSNLSIHQVFEQQAAKLPHHPAVYFDGQYLSYKELNQQANRLAHYLLTLAVKDESNKECNQNNQEQIVAICLSLIHI